MLPGSFAARLRRTDETHPCIQFASGDDAGRGAEIGAGTDPEAGSSQGFAEGGRCRAGLQPAQRPVEDRETERLSRKEERDARDLRSCFHRWLNETTPSGPVWT